MSEHKSNTSQNAVEPIGKVVVIGLDGASPDWVRSWIESGELPTLQQTAANGVFGTLKSTVPPLSPAAWSSFATGKNPGQHGIFDHVYRREGEYRLSPVSSRRCESKSLWRILSEQGKKVGVMNVPVTYPPHRVNGFMITGMYTPSPEAHYTYPPKLKEELAAIKMAASLFAEVKDNENYDVALQMWHDRQSIRIKLASYLMERFNPEFFAFVIGETDRVQHRFWKFMDSSHPLHDVQEATKYGGAILDLFKAVDRNLENLLGSLDDDTALIVMSDHGFGPLRRCLYINNWLLEEGYLKLKPSPLVRLKWHLYRRGYTPHALLSLVSKLKLGMTTRAVGSAKKAREKKSFVPYFFLSVADVDWSSTRAYALGGNLAGVYLNVKGREPEGTVQPGEEYERLRDEIIDRLYNLKDDETGESVFRQVIRREEVYSGDCLERAPDIVFLTTNDQYVPLGAQQFMFGSSGIMGMPSWPPDSGTHTSSGLLMMKGKPFKQDFEISGAEIIDLAPTVLYLMGLDIPSDMDGRVLTEAFLPEFLAANEIRHTSAEASSEYEAQVGYSVEEEEEIKERLRSLGYLG